MMILLQVIYTISIFCIYYHDDAVFAEQVLTTTTNNSDRNNISMTIDVTTVPTTITLNTTVKVEQNTSSIREIISKGMVSLSLNLNSLLLHTNIRKENILFAPVNIVKTLATVMLGTAGETEKEIANALGWASQIDLLAGARMDSIHTILGTLLEELTTKSPGTELGVNLNVAAGIFIQNGIKVLPEYMKTAESVYHCDINSVDFSKNGSYTLKLINDWISNKTFGRIKNLLMEPLSSDTIILFAGALYFNGNWEYPFSPKYTRWQPFYLGSEGRESASKVQVQMMVNAAIIPYYEDHILGFQALGVPYEKKEIMMYIILPKLNLDLKNLTASLTPENIRNIVKNSVDTDIVYALPKMKLEAKINLRSASEKLGVHTLFDPKLANFTKLADGIYADEILHQVELEVNELGTIGSAATAITVTRTSTKVFRADRPFLIFIYNRVVDVVTFWGNVYKPVPNKEY